MSNGRSSVYFAAHRDPHRVLGAPVPVKIGVAGDVKVRLSCMQSGNPVAIELLGYADGDETEERYLHEQFVASHIRGEWYALTPALEALIERTARDPGVLVRVAERREPVGKPGVGSRGLTAILDHIDVERLERRTCMDRELIRRWGSGERVHKAVDVDLRAAAAALGLRVFEDEDR